MRHLLVALVFAAACNTPTETEQAVPGTFDTTGEKLMVVNGEVTITQDMVDAVTRKMPPEHIQAMKEPGGNYEDFVRQIAMGQMLYEEAIAAGLHKDPDVMNGVQMSVREALAAEMVQKKIAAEITDAKVQEYYDSRKVQFQVKQAKARHILVQEKALAEEIIEKLNGGEDFATLAKAHSIDPKTKIEGGDLGWFTQRELLPEVGSMAFEGELKKPLGPIETRFGFHILLVEDRREAVPLEDVKPQIVGKLREQVTQTVIRSLQGSMTSEAFGELAAIKKKGGYADTLVPPPPAIQKGPGAGHQGGGGHGPGDGHGHGAPPAGGGH